MVKTIPLEKKIERRIRRTKDATFVLSDFFDYSERDQILRALRKLIQKKVIIRVGQGVYTRAKVSSVTKKVIPEQNLRAIAITALKKTGVKVVPTTFERDYNEGRSTQVPTGLVIGVTERVSRKIGFNGRYVKYERITTC